MDRARPLHRGLVFYFQTLVAVASDHGCGGAWWNAPERVRENVGAPTSSICGRLVRRLVGLQLCQRSHHWGDAALRAARPVYHPGDQKPARSRVNDFGGKFRRCPCRFQSDRARRALSN